MSLRNIKTNLGKLYETEETNKPASRRIKYITQRKSQDQTKLSLQKQSVQEGEAVINVSIANIQVSPLHI